MPWKAVGLVGPLIGLGAIGSWDRFAILPTITLYDLTTAVRTVVRVLRFMHINRIHTGTAVVASVRCARFGAGNAIGPRRRFIETAGQNNLPRVIRSLYLTILSGKCWNPLIVPRARTRVVADALLRAGCVVLAWSTGGCAFIDVRIALAVGVVPAFLTLAAITVGACPTGSRAAGAHRVGRSRADAVTTAGVGAASRAHLQALISIMSADTPTAIESLLLAGSSCTRSPLD
jgi:hypothetical protein